MLRWYCIPDLWRWKIFIYANFFGALTFANTCYQIKKFNFVGTYIGKCWKDNALLEWYSHFDDLIEGRFVCGLSKYASVLAITLELNLFPGVFFLGLQSGTSRWEPDLEIGGEAIQTQIAEFWHHSHHSQRLVTLFFLQTHK